MKIQFKIHKKVLLKISSSITKSLCQQLDKYDSHTHDMSKTDFKRNTGIYHFYNRIRDDGDL